MTIKRRFALLLGSLFGAFFVAVFVLRQMEASNLRAMLDRDRQARAQLLNHWIDLASRTLPQYASDAAQSPEFARLLAQPEEAVRKQLEASLGAAGLTALWVLRADGSVIAGAGAPDFDSNLPPLLDAQEFSALIAETPSPRFFAEHHGHLFEVCVRRLQTEATTPAWLMVARQWDDAQLHALSSLAEAEVTLRGSNDHAHAPADDSRIVLVRSLNDWRGHPLRVLRVEAPGADIERAVGTDWQNARVFIAFGLLLIVAMGLALQHWIVRPLATIRASLQQARGDLVAPLAGEKSEVGELARLVVSSFAQREALQREIAVRTEAQEALARSEATLRHNLEERARLGRDLHDGVIQSLYAAGMGLAGIRSLLHAEQTEAAVRLEQTRAALNETIHDVRNFIIGLEPEALKLQTFSQAVAAQLDVMRGMRSFRSTVEIDEQLAGRLSLAQRVHALQITREAVSNALRHGEASHIEVGLQLRDGFAEFEVADDGRGFDAPHVVSQGKGLANFAERARELGAELGIDSQPGRGTRVKLTFSLPNL